MYSYKTVTVVTDNKAFCKIVSNAGVAGSSGAKTDQWTTLGWYEIYGYGTVEALPVDGEP